MQLVKRTVRRSGRILATGYFLIGGDYRSPSYPSLISIVSDTSIEMLFNPDFLTLPNSKVTFEVLADEPILNHAVFLSKYPEFFL